MPLKVWISDIVSNLLYDLGYPVAQNGAMIMIGSYELMVKDACSGMNSIFALSAIGIFYIHEFVRDNPIRKVILILSIVPITILANVFRVVTLVLGAYYIGVDTIEGLFHDLTGIALFVFALMLFFLLDRVLIGVEYLAGRALGSRSGVGERARRTALTDSETRTQACARIRDWRLEQRPRAGRLGWRFPSISQFGYSRFSVHGGEGTAGRQSRSAEKLDRQNADCLRFC